MSIHDQPAPMDTPAVPEHPRLLRGLPVLWHSPDTAQLGVHPKHAVVLKGLTPTQAALLRALDGRFTVRELMARMDVEDGHQQLRTLLTTLVTSGVIEDAGPDGVAGRLAPEVATWALRTGRAGAEAVLERRHCTVIVHGSGRLAVNVATMLAAAGVGWVHVHAQGVVCQEDTGCGYLDSDVGTERRAAAREAIRRAAPDVLVDPLPRHRLPDLVILADAEVPEPAVVADVAGRGIPHLVVRCTAGVGLVGPLVVPGRSACVRCYDLRRAEREPHWAALADQLAGHPQQPEVAAAGMAAALAAGQTLLALAQPDLAEHPPACWNATLEMDAMLGALERSEFQPHPDCGCAASAAGRPSKQAVGLRNGQIRPYAQVRQATGPVDHHPRVTGNL